MHCRLGLVTVGRYSILRVQKLHIVGNNYLCWKGLDSKGLNVFLKDIVVLASLFYLSCWRVFHSFSFKSHHQKFLFYCNRPTDQRKQANDSVLTACYFPLTYHLKPIHVTTSCGGTHTKSNISLLSTLSKADSKSRGKVYVDFMLSVLVGSVAR